MFRILAAGLAVCGFAACGQFLNYPQRLPDGSYRTTCNAPLSSCLQKFDEICETHGYDVIAASESRSRTDLREIPSVTVTSEAQVRCKRGKPLFGSSSEEPPAAPPPTPPAAAPAPAAAPLPAVPPPAPPAPAAPPSAPDPGAPPGDLSGYPEPGTNLCRGGPSHDRDPRCRELGPLSAPAPALTGPRLSPDVDASNRGARTSGPRTPAPTTAGTAAAAFAAFDSWPAGSSPREIGARVARNYLSRPLARGVPMHYAEACTWYGALTTAALLRDAALEKGLIARFSPIVTASGASIIPLRAHVDDRVFGIVPLEIAMHGGTKSLEFLFLGKEMADKQWATTTADGITTEARYWVDDMYMIPALQVQTFRATGDERYLDRAALTMAAYLDRLQQPNGLFFTRRPRRATGVAATAGSPPA